jgi:hypothetical protein
MIPRKNREHLSKAMSKAADKLLQQQGLNWLARKGARWLVVNPQLRKALSL